MAAAGWYPDPWGRAGWRYFDGAGWTGHVAAHGRAWVDDGHTPPPGVPEPVVSAAATPLPPTAGAKGLIVFSRPQGPARPANRTRQVVTITAAAVAALVGLGAVAGRRTTPASDRQPAPTTAAVVVTVARSSTSTATTARATTAASTAPAPTAAPTTATTVATSVATTAPITAATVPSTPPPATEPPTTPATEPPPPPVTPAPVTPPPVAAGSSSAGGGSGGSCGDGAYMNSNGVCVQGPVSGPRPPAGATARCKDGTWSTSQNRRGTCSGHGGVAEWLVP